ncbi:MAG: SMC-Scp complex subunit ScpB [Verrucomicrobia bacterium]|nr:SMC-Scp complex subunit ScpB [Verrucomicrobiota bacterium]
MELKSILEAVLFASQKPLTTAELKGVLNTAAEQAEDAEVRSLKKTKADALETALEALQADHAQAARAYRLVCVAGAWQFVTEPEFGPWLRALSGERLRPARLSQPALETLTIVAYRQPITRAEIEQIRGVSVDGVMQTLLERGLVEALGRAEVVGRPMTYGTTKVFLEYFGLRNLEELPAADELRRIAVERPPALLTVEAGLATAPPEQLALPSQAEPTATAGGEPGATPTDDPAPLSPASPEAEAEPAEKAEPQADPASGAAVS